MTETKTKIEIEIETDSNSIEIEIEIETREEYASHSDRNVIPTNRTAAKVVAALQLNNVFAEKMEILALM